MTKGPSSLPPNPVLDLVNAAWSMCVEQQHHITEGWSMAKSWAWDRLNEAVEPFLRRDVDGDVIEMSSTPVGPSAVGWPTAEKGSQP